MHPSAVRHLHASDVFHALRVRPSITQAELAAITRCNRSTVSVIIKRFESLGLVERIKEPSSAKRGRRSEQIRISPEGGVLVGVRLQPGAIEIGSTGLDGTRLGSHTIPAPDHPGALADAVMGGIQDLIARQGRQMSAVRTIGAGVPGLVSSTGRLAHSPNLKWYDIAVLDLLRERTTTPIFVDNETHGITLAEHLFGACTEEDDFIFVESSSGFGGGLFLDGHVYRGTSGFAGEIGHTKVVPGGRLCRCGAMGCLSAYLSVPSLLQRLEQCDVPARSLADIEMRAAAGENVVLGLLYEAGSFLGIALANVINVFSPPKIVLGGALAPLEPYLAAGFRRSLEQHALPAPLALTEIITAKLDASVFPWAGLAIALDGLTSLQSTEVSLW